MSFLGTKAAVRQMTACSFPLEWDLKAWEAIVTKRDRTKLPGVAAFNGQDYVPSMDTFWNATPESSPGFRTPDRTVHPIIQTPPSPSQTSTSELSPSSAKKRMSTVMDDDILLDEFKEGGGRGTQVEKLASPTPSGGVAPDGRASRHRDMGKELNNLTKHAPDRALDFQALSTLKIPPKKKSKVDKGDSATPRASPKKPRGRPPGSSKTAADKRMQIDD